MAGFRDLVNFGAGRDEFAGGFEFLGGGEGIARAVDKDGGDAEIGEVFGAELGRLAGRMERVREERECIGDFGVFRGDHARLAAAVGLTAEIDGARYFLAHLGNGFANEIAILRGRAASGEIEAEDVDAGLGEGFGDGGEERGIVIAAGSVCEREAFSGGIVCWSFCFVHIQLRC